MTLTLTVIDKGPEAMAHNLKHLKNFLQVFDNPLHSDIAFTFARPQQPSLRLYSSRGLLSGFDDHFKTMFEDDGFKESLDVTDGEQATKDAPLQVEDEDSDHDRDLKLIQNLVMVHEPLKLKEIPMPHACYTTYRALLFYLEIEFAFLKSNRNARDVCSGNRIRVDEEFARDGEDGKSFATSTESVATPKKPSTDLDAFADLKREYYILSGGQRDVIGFQESFLAVSPKSIYKLAHVYDIQPLKDLALQNIVDQLTSDNILFEITSDFSAKYPDVRAKETEYLIQNWKKVAASPVHEHFKSPENESFVASGADLYTLFSEIMGKLQEAMEELQRLSSPENFSDLQPGLWPGKVMLLLCGTQKLNT
ncbi:hypothetical protein BT69DRAFT_1329296 [Atractiella rhizophila]|nr:hypothetical protein BT69DRAFT_1329296 [Atractiella rhizophila]